MNTPTLRSELEPLIPELDRALEVVGKAGEIIQRYTKSNDMVFDTTFRFWGETKGTSFWMRLAGDIIEYENAIAILNAAEAYKPADPEEKKRKEIARLEAELAKLKGEA